MAKRKGKQIIQIPVEQEFLNQIVRTRVS
jgi:hypothetical protein